MGWIRAARQRSRVRALACTVGVGLVLLAPRDGVTFDWLKAGRDLLQGGSESQSPSLGSLTDAEISAGLKDALKVGTERVVYRLGRLDGFNTDPQIHIPLPAPFGKVGSVLAAIGKAAMLDDLELRLNRAAEQAAPLAKQLFWDAIRQMTLEDVKLIYNGPEDAATRYFQARMSRPLAEAMLPLVQDRMAQVGALQAYDALMGQYRSIPFVPDVKADLTAYVVEKGSDGIFYYLAREEAAIRQDPVKRTTKILQQVFGAR